MVKPGGYVTAFCGTRTYHRMVCGIEDAGFEIKDTMLWLYGNGYPKGKNSLKPACDLIVLAKKKISEKNITENVRVWGTGQLNIKDCKIKYNNNTMPTNIILDNVASTILDQQTGASPRFFYITKPSQREREFGLDDIESAERGRWGKGGEWTNDTSPVKNNIATLKPINLMRYLIKLVTPQKGIVLDPFAGSGTTGCACAIDGYSYILFEKRERFVNEIIPRRIGFWSQPYNQKHLTEHNLLTKPNKSDIKYWL